MTGAGSWLPDKSINPSSVWYPFWLDLYSFYLFLIHSILHSILLSLSLPIYISYLRNRLLSVFYYRLRVGIVGGNPWVTQPGPHPYLPNRRGPRVYPSKRAQKQPKRLRIDWDMSKTVFFDCLNHISVISEPFGLFLGLFENWWVGASEPVPVPTTT